jgi:hypothetical protein
MNNFVAFALTSLMVFGCKSSSISHEREKNSLAALTASVEKYFLDKEFNKITTLTGNESMPKSISTSIESLLSFVRSNHPRNEFNISTEDWIESVHGGLLPGKVEYRKLKFKAPPNGVIVIKWSSPNAVDSVSVTLAFKVEKGLYSICAPQFAE